MREDGIRKRLEDAKKRVVESGADDVKLRALESVVKSKRAEFERLQAQVEAARTTGDAVAVPVEVQIISRARTPSEKSSPRTGMIIAMAAVATFLFGLAVVVLHAMFTSARAGTARSTSVGTWTPSGARSAAASSWIAPKAPPPAEVRSIAGIARYLVEKAERRSGFRTIVTPETAHIALGEFPADLARHLAILKRQVILIEWSPEGISLPGNVPTLGLADVLAGNASFEDVIAPLMGSNAHVISAGTGIATPSGSVERDRINMLLDALDEVYDHIVITGAYPVMRELFTTVEGCIDAGVVLATPNSTPALGDFLGYSVPDLDVIRFEQEAGDVDGEGFGSIRPGHRPSGPSLSASA